MKLVLVLLTACALFICIVQFSCSSDPDPVPVAEDVFINEVFSNGAGDDWVELYNSSGATKDISGYYLYDDAADKYRIPTGTSIPANGVIVFICNGMGTGLQTNFRLSSEGETIYLDNASQQLIDKVDFPAMINGQSYGRYPDGATNLALSGSPTQGTLNGGTGAPAFVEVLRTPLVPSPADPVTIQVKLADNTGITTVSLKWRLGSGGFTTATMTLAGSYYSATIPAAGTTGKVEYYVEATNSAGNTSTKPVDAPGDTYSYLLNTDPLPALVINEFLASNTSCCPDVDGGSQEFDDWIEIYNAGGTAINLGGMYLSDDENDPFKAKIPDDNPSATTIQPGGYLLFWADENGSQGDLHLNFQLNGAGEYIGLFYIDGRTIDDYSFGPQTENVSWGRTTDGAGTWKAFAAPSPKASN